MDGEVFFKTGVTLDSLVFNVGNNNKPPFGDGNHTTYKNDDDWGIVYDCFTHINVFNLLLQPGISVLTLFFGRVSKIGHENSSQKQAVARSKDVQGIAPRIGFWKRLEIGYASICLAGQSFHVPTLATGRM